MKNNIRLYLKQPMHEGQEIILEPAQAHYLFTVMRLREGHTIFVFNGYDDECAALIKNLAKRTGSLIIGKKTHPFIPAHNLWLIFAPIKKERTDFIVEKATELGVARILPVCTAYSNTRRVNNERLKAHIIEAAEQCGATSLPQLDDLQALKTVLNMVESNRSLIFCDETTCIDAMEAGENTQKPYCIPTGRSAILIGPEAGFSPTERKMLYNYPNITRLGLGNRILRADTAAVVAIALWQQAQASSPGSLPDKT